MGDAGPRDAPRPCRGLGCSIHLQPQRIWGFQHPLQLWVPPVLTWGLGILQGTLVPMMFADGPGSAAPWWPAWHWGCGGSFP